MMGHAFGHSARIDEDQSGAVCLNQFRQTVINFLPDFVRHHRFQWRLRNFNRQVQFAAMADVNNGAIRISSLVHRASTHQKSGHFLDRFLRRGQTYSLKRMFSTARPIVRYSERGVRRGGRPRLRGSRRQPSPHRAQHSPAGFRSEQQIQGFRRGNKNVRRLFDQGSALCSAGVSRPNFSTNVDLTPAFPRRATLCECQRVVLAGSLRMSLLKALSGET